MLPHEEYLLACGPEETVKELQRLVRKFDRIGYKTPFLQQTSWFFDLELYKEVKKSIDHNLLYMYLYARFFCAYLSSICIKNRCMHGRLRYYPTTEPVIQKWCCRHQDAAKTFLETERKFCSACATKMIRGVHNISS